MTEDKLNRYEQLTLEYESQFLSFLIFYLSMLARDTYIPGRYINELDRARAFNEMIHRTAEQLLKCFRRERGYEKKLFFDILADLSHSASCSDDVMWAIERSLRDATTESG